MTVGLAAAQAVRPLSVMTSPQRLFCVTVAWCCWCVQSLKVLGGGIDVLEAIGRRTYDVLAEGEHGLKKTIEKSRENRPTLSQACDPA